MNLIFNKIYYYYHTVKYLTSYQILFYIYYKIKRKFISFFPSYYYKMLQSNCSQYLSIKNIKLNNSFIINYNFDPNDIIKNRYNFLNVYKDLGVDIDWNNPELNKGTRLWKLNLNYHDYLIEVARAYFKTGDKKYADYIIKHIQSWVVYNPIGTVDFYKDNWNSYAISNRVISWIKVFPVLEHKLGSNYSSNKIINFFLKNLRIQLEYLYRNIEYDLRANHLLENGFALLFGAYFFRDDRLFLKAENILKTEINEQILNDGYHIELSPMYQQHIAHRLLDSFNLMSNNKFILMDQNTKSLSDELLNREKFLLNSIENASSMLISCLSEITFNNGDIPLFNDSAFNVYPSTDQLISYSESLNINISSMQLDESGYRTYKNKNYECIMNVGGIKAHYMPGHAHSDIFSFILYIKNQPFIVDTGTSTYDFGKRRILERLTKSHNTVQIKDFEQLETWSSFRVANRNNAKIILDRTDEIKAELNYKKNKLKHIRHFQFKNNNLKIFDKVLSNYKSKAYLHLHPNITVKIKDNIIITNLCSIQIIGSDNFYLDNYMYAPEFNTLIKSKVIIIEFDSELETRIEIV